MCFTAFQPPNHNHRIVDRNKSKICAKQSRDLPTITAEDKDIVVIGNRSGCQRTMNNKNKVLVCSLTKVNNNREGKNNKVIENKSENHRTDYKRRNTEIKRRKVGYYKQLQRLKLKKHYTSKLFNGTTFG